MPFNGSGTYSLPGGNPVVTGTTITSSWANTTLADVATALSAVLVRDGQAAMTGTLNLGGNRLSNLHPGSAASPSLFWTGNGINTGLYAPADDQIGISIDGVLKGLWFSQGQRILGTTMHASAALQVNGARSYFSGASANIALGVAYNETRATAAQAIHFGATDSATPSLNITNAGGTTLVTVDNAGAMVVTTTVTANSDERLKTDFKRLELTVEQLASLPVYEYTRRDTGRQELGFKAQDVEAILPLAVHYSDDGIRSLDYMRLGAIAAVVVAKRLAHAAS